VGSPPLLFHDWIPIVKAACQLLHRIGSEPSAAIDILDTLLYLFREDHLAYGMKTRITRHTFIGMLSALLVCASFVQAQSSAINNLKLEEIDGTTSTLSDYLRVGPVYMTFWALWCEPCKQELHALKPFAKEHQDQPFTILAINQDTPKSLAKVKAYAKSQSYPFPVVLDPNAQILQAFNGQNLPFSVLLNKEGKVVSTRTGYLPGDVKEIEKEIMRLLR
jgi:cytochrome c biogenesis protein CcmG/thiol:disulfide interchange protein DsbE